MHIRNNTQGFFQDFIAEIGVAKAYISKNVLSAAELRFSFIMQVIGMMLNNVAFLLVWIFFFQAFGQINGWGTTEVLALQGFIGVVYGLVFFLCTGASHLPNVVNNGSFDSVLLTPRSLYFRILTLTTQPSAFGDILYGLILLAFYFFIAQIGLSQIILLFLLFIPTTVIVINFLLITSCLSFFFPEAEDLSRNAFELMFGPSLYPSGVYQGASRVFFLFVLPTIAIAGLPVEAVKTFDLSKILIICCLAVVWTLIAIFVLNKGVKRYESGNLTGARI